VNTRDQPSIALVPVLVMVMFDQLDLLTVR
jgi:hypothetical protein